MPSTKAESETLNHGIILPNWVVDGDTERLVEYGVAAEAAGWDGVFLADHLAHDAQIDFPDPWITLAGIAARTTDIQLGSWVTPIPRRQPWQLARDLATLDRLSDGRVILGTGLGRDFDYTSFGEAWEPKRLGEKYDEALKIITGLWREAPFSYDGDHYTIDEATVLPTPAQQPRIPIIVGGVWPNKKPFHRGARWDGIVPHYRGDGVVPKDGGIFTRESDKEIEPKEEVTEMVEYYHDLADDPGMIFLPANPPHRSSNWLEQLRDLSVAWAYTRPRDESGEWYLDGDLIRDGPSD